MIIILLWKGGGPMRGKHEDGNDSFCSNHTLHHCVNFKERPIKRKHPNFDLCLRMGVFATKTFGLENT